MTDGVRESHSGQLHHGFKAGLLADLVGEVLGPRLDAIEIVHGGIAIA